MGRGCHILHHYSKMQLMQLELLAPAKNKDIGIAAIDCGADAIYIAGPMFGAREAASNSIEDIAQLAEYAHKFNAKVYATVNTLLYEDEIQQAVNLIWQLYQAGIDAVLVQDYQLLSEDLPPIELHASTQAVCRTPQQAKALEALGFKRLVLERQLSLDQIADIRAAVNCELEFFVHGALCMCYSGECFLSEEITGRSANRGACIQACRSQYDLTDASGQTIISNYPLLSLKDYRLDDDITQLAKAGICSFKIEGRLKNESYVRNVVRHYSKTLDSFIDNNLQDCRASAGKSSGGFEPQIDATFNRGYTSLFLNGKKELWLSGDTTRSIGEYVGKIAQLDKTSIVLDGNATIHNGDGFCAVNEYGEQIGFRVDVCNGSLISLKSTSGLKKGQQIFRNYNIAFEKEIKTNIPVRLIDATIDFRSKSITASCSDGITVSMDITEDYPPARNIATAVEGIRHQLSKKAGVYCFQIGSIDDIDVRFYPASALNSFRRTLAELLNNERAKRQQYLRVPFIKTNAPLPPQRRKAEKEVMRSKYCIKNELGLCHKYGIPLDKRLVGVTIQEPLYLINNGLKLGLQFDCTQCEMSVIIF